MTTFSHSSKVAHGRGRAWNSARVPKRPYSQLGVRVFHPTHTSPPQKPLTQISGSIRFFEAFFYSLKPPSQTRSSFHGREKRKPRTNRHRLSFSFACPPSPNPYRLWKAISLVHLTLSSNIFLLEDNNPSTKKIKNSIFAKEIYLAVRFSLSSLLDAIIKQ